MHFVLFSHYDNKTKKTIEKLKSDCNDVKNAYDDMCQHIEFKRIKHFLNYLARLTARCHEPSLKLPLIEIGKEITNYYNKTVATGFVPFKTKAYALEALHQYIDETNISKIINDFQQKTIDSILNASNKSHHRDAGVKTIAHIGDLYLRM